MLNKSMLRDVFSVAREKELNYVVVGINTPDGKEAIVIPSDSFDSKEKFYMSAYNDDLTHVMNSNVRIFNFIAVDAAESIPYVFDVDGLTGEQLKE